MEKKEVDKKELEALRKEVAYWKFRYGNLLEMQLDTAWMVPDVLISHTSEQRGIGYQSKCRRMVEISIF